MKYIFLISLIVITLLGETIPIMDFRTDLFSKNSSSLKKIRMDLVIESNTTVADYKIKDALNITISSYFIEDLFTSQIKEQFKILFKNYLKSKENIDIQNIYIEKMEIINQVDLDELVKRLEAKKDTKEEEKK